MNENTIIFYDFRLLHCLRRLGLGGGRGGRPRGRRQRTRSGHRGRAPHARRALNLSRLRLQEEPAKKQNEKVRKSFDKKIGNRKRTRTREKNAVRTQVTPRSEGTTTQECRGLPCGGTPKVRAKNKKQIMTTMESLPFAAGRCEGWEEEGKFEKS